MSENVCCPMLKIVECSDTKEHRHLYCDSQHTIEQVLMDNNWLVSFCISAYKECKYYPKEG